MAKREPIRARMVILSYKKDLGVQCSHHSIYSVVISQRAGLMSSQQGKSPFHIVRFIFLGEKKDAQTEGKKVFLLS